MGIPAGIERFSTSKRFSFAIGSVVHDNLAFKIHSISVPQRLLWSRLWGGVKRRPSPDPLTQLQRFLGLSIHGTYYSPMCISAVRRRRISDHQRLAFGHLHYRPLDHLCIHHERVGAHRDW